MNRCCSLMTQTNLFSSGFNAISLQEGVNNDLTIIAEWLKVNKLSLNIKKTHFMCFSAKNKNFKYLIGRLMYRTYHEELRVLHCLFTKKIAIYMYTIPTRSAIICHCVELTWGSVVWDMMVLLRGTTFVALISIQTSASWFSLEVLKQQYAITCFNLSYYHMTLYCWYITTGNVISANFSVAPSAPLLKHTCYMWNRQGAHKSHRISSSICSHDNLLLYLYWYL